MQYFPGRIDPSLTHAVPCSSRGRLITRFALGLLLVLVPGAWAGASATGTVVRGLPFSRVYSLEDIGYIPRGSRLGFDNFGRLAVMHDGVYAVLNDTAWLNIAETGVSSRVPMTIVVPGPEGAYYGGRASWGFAKLRSDGQLHAVPLVPADPPAWTQSTTFEDVFVTRAGVYFCSRSGVVFLDSIRGDLQMFELAKASRAFRVGDQVFVSSFEHPLRYLDVAQRAVRDVPSPILDGAGDNVVEHATILDQQRALVAMLDGRIFAFDGTTARPWPDPGRVDLGGRITELEHLDDGNIAIAITGRGVFVLSPDGELLSSLTIPQYHRVSEIASSEPGVMWLINEDSIEKILYSCGLTTFGQRLGLPLDWPVVAVWQGRTFVASAGILYEASPAPPGSASRFERLPNQPPNGAWALAAWGPHLLVGNPYGTYAAAADGSFTAIPHVRDLAHLVMIDAARCYAISPTEIGLLTWDGTHWTESVPRIPGVRNPAVVHRAQNSAWIETGAAGVARVALQDGRLDLTIVRNEPWTHSLWVNVGAIDDVVVLSGGNERRFFQESTASWCERPDLMQLLNRSPAWLARVRSGADGTLWATHNEGVVRFTPRNGDYEMDATSFDLINDRYPVVKVLPNDEVWVSASRSLYHVEPGPAMPVRPAAEPVLVSLMDTRSNVELLPTISRARTIVRVPYGQNSLTFRFFSGGYAWRRTPNYEFRLTDDEPWSALDTGSLLRFPGLHEGVYRLQVRIAGAPGTPGPPLEFPFEILPPWHRTWPAYLLYSAALVLVVFGTIRWSIYLARKRNRVLEQIVRERTSQLETTMQKLNEETRISATLAERDRLAGEIHDSVQQGLSGAILQLDTTRKNSALPPDLRARLDVVRNMVSYARQEVQHAVWDMESPLLDDNDLGEALRKLTTFLSSGPPTPKVVVTGSPIPLPRATTHHLLRIAQEVTTNALRHANAAAIEIRLTYQHESVALEISDDGVGFHPESVLNQAGHFGLRGIRARARKLRGQITITSSPGEGTSIQMLVPLTSAPHVTDAENKLTEQNSNPVGR